MKPLTILDPSRPTSATDESREDKNIWINPTSFNRIDVHANNNEWKRGDFTIISGYWRHHRCFCGSLLSSLSLHSRTPTFRRNSGCCDRDRWREWPASESIIKTRTRKGGKSGHIIAGTSPLRQYSGARDGDGLILLNPLATAGSKHFWPGWVYASKWRRYQVSQSLLT